MSIVGMGSSRFEILGCWERSILEPSELELEDGGFVFRLEDILEVEVFKMFFRVLDGSLSPKVVEGRTWIWCPRQV